MAKTFRDNVHGYITLPETCIRIIDTRQFQRLRRLKQLSVASFVFPNANHSRFEHSLGVAHLAGKLAGLLAQAQPELGITPGDVEMLQIAGLVHDIGHGPFSHTYERAVPGFNHEEHGLRIWAVVAGRLDLPEATRAFVRGCVDVKQRIPGDKGWMYQLIHHAEGGMDVDRLDYSIRDAKVASVSITYDLDRILTNWRVDVASGMFVFPASLAADIISAHRARFMLFDTVYNHRVVLIIEAMMADVLREMVEMGEISPARDGDDVVYGTLSGRASDLLERIECRKFGEYENAPRTAVSHYGAGAQNPMDAVLFDPPLTQAWQDAYLPRSFVYERLG